MLIRGESREVWIFSLTASCCTTLWKTICYPFLLASLAFTFPKLRASKQRKHFQVQVKSSEENVKVDDFFLWFSKSVVIQLVKYETLVWFTAAVLSFETYLSCSHDITFVPHFKLNSD